MKLSIANGAACSALRSQQDRALALYKRGLAKYASEVTIVGPTGDDTADALRMLEAMLRGAP